MVTACLKDLRLNFYYIIFCFLWFCENTNRNWMLWFHISIIHASRMLTPSVRAALVLMVMYKTSLVRSFMTISMHRVLIYISRRLPFLLLASFYSSLILFIFPFYLFQNQPRYRGWALGTTCVTRVLSRALLGTTAEPGFLWMFYVPGWFVLLVLSNLTFWQVSSDHRALTVTF